MRKGVAVVYEMRSLEQVSPRFVSAVQVVNMKERIEGKEHGYKLKNKITNLILSKFQLPAKLVQDSVTYSIDSILLPSLLELQKSKHSIHLTQCLSWCLTTYTCFLSDLRSLTPQ